ncbi:hypothetical protein MP638_001180 [Amoeboaphelidium occidentale]|nr:hypothetical protein MP638_001180 [Amoeboaphelidium occidentale]
MFTLKLLLILILIQLCLIHSTKQSVTITSTEEGFKQVYVEPNQKLSTKITVTSSTQLELSVPTELYESGYIVLVSKDNGKKFMKLVVNSTESVLKGLIDTTSTGSFGVGELRIVLKEKKKSNNNNNNNNNNKKRLDWVIGTIEFDSNFASPGKKEFPSTASTSSVDDDDYMDALPLIQHTFRPAFKQPSVVVALFFSLVSVVVPWVLLIVSYNYYYGWNINKISTQKFNAFVFVFGGLLGFVYLLTMYFWKWTFFQVLLPLMVVGVSGGD